MTWGIVCLANAYPSNALYYDTYLAIVGGIPPVAKT
jgi:hypothetical protein